MRTTTAPGAARGDLYRRHPHPRGRHIGVTRHTPGGLTREEERDGTQAPSGSGGGLVGGSGGKLCVVCCVLCVASFASLARTLQRKGGRQSKFCAAGVSPFTARLRRHGRRTARGPPGRRPSRAASAKEGGAQEPCRASPRSAASAFQQEARSRFREAMRSSVRAQEFLG